VLYLDTSALTKLVVQEPETAALRAFLAEREGERLVSSALIRTELRRAALRFGERADVTREQAEEAAQEATALLRRLDLVRVGSAMLDRAGLQPPSQLRSLDAIHLTTALRLSPQLHTVIVYDQRLANVARYVGLAVAAPGQPRDRV
jgi:uncharacterized protein